MTGQQTSPISWTPAGLPTTEMAILAVQGCTPAARLQTEAPGRLAQPPRRPGSGQWMSSCGVGVVAKWGQRLLESRPQSPASSTRQRQRHRPAAKGAGLMMGLQKKHKPMHKPMACNKVDDSNIDEKLIAMILLGASQAAPTPFTFFLNLSSNQAPCSGRVLNEPNPAALTVPGRGWSPHAIFCLSAYH